MIIKTFTYVLKVFIYFQQNKITLKVNESILRARECFLHLQSRVQKVLGVQLYNNNARALLLRIFSILNSNWLQHARSVREMYDVTHFFLGVW